MNRVKREPIEIIVEGQCLPLAEQEGNTMRFLDPNELVQLLKKRLEMSENEVRQLLESYHPSTLNLS